MNWLLTKLGGKYIMNKEIWWCTLNFAQEACYGSEA